MGNYFRRGIRFFAFDIITISPEKKTVRPLAYEFKTDHLYYPLEVTNLYGGVGTIELFLILPQGLIGVGGVKSRLDVAFRSAAKDLGQLPAFVRREQKKWGCIVSTAATVSRFQ